jgi:hypothetical protein
MGDLKNFRLVESKIWEKDIYTLHIEELERAFNESWKTAPYADESHLRLAMLTAEINSRTSKRYFCANLFISLVALIIAFFGLFAAR